jgi:hypothetical protein
MSKNVANHLHRYKKVNLARKTEEEYLVYKCTKPLCSHYAPMNLVEGKLCECNICGDSMIITREVLIHSGGKPMARPRCSGCIKRKKSETVDAIAAFLNQKV